MKRNRTARQHNFAIIPKSNIPRSKFPFRTTRKLGFNASELIPIFVVETLPGDYWQHRESISARLATPIAPLLDDLDIETFYFHVPNRIVDPNWEDFITGADDTLLLPTIRPATMSDYSITANSIFDFMGLLPQVYTAPGLSLNVLPIWGYFTIYNQWFRDQNLQSEWTWDPDWPSNTSMAITQDSIPWDQMPLRANKRHDYFTSALPWPQKGDPITLSFTGNAPVISAGDGQPAFRSVPDDGTSRAMMIDPSGVLSSWSGPNHGITRDPMEWDDTKLEADLSSVAMTTINTIRIGTAMQQLLERDARGGSRYVENLMAHWGVRAQDFRLAIPEYIGGTKIPVVINPIAQTASYTAEPDDSVSPVGNLGAEMHASSSKRLYTYAVQEHGHIIGLAVARSTPTYQQGTARMWTRNTRADFFDPLFANLGEQAIRTQEIFQNASNTPVNATFGYQERAAEYRYLPNSIHGVLRSTHPQTMDWWHLAEEFGLEPALNAEFIEDRTKETLSRCLATDLTTQWTCQIIMDILHEGFVARLMPAYGIPGLTRF